MSIVSVFAKSPVVRDILTSDTEHIRPRLLLLLGQSFTFGILVALVVIIGNTLFLSDFSSDFLPYVYFAVAVLGSLLSYATTRAQRTWTVPVVARTTMALFVLIFGLTWIARLTTGAPWVSFVLISAYPLVLRMSFVILGWQAGQLFDVRQIKVLFPHIVTGFVIGFIAGGLLVPLLLNVMSATENVILAMALASLIILGLILRVGRQYADIFQQETQKARKRKPLSLLQLLRKPFVRWMFFYQLLMAVVSKFTDYLLLAQTEARFTTEIETAQFFSTFYTVLNSVDLFLLLVVASIFLRRFGLKAGLLANPIFLLVNVGLMLVVVPLLGDTSSAFFILVILSRITIVTMTDAATRTSVNATYQALPAQERSMAQTAAEGMATQLALGVVGGVLLLFNAFPGITITHVVLVTFVLVLLWSVDSLALYRAYATRLMQTIKRRALRYVELTVTDAAGLAAVEQLLQSDRGNEVRLALDVLAQADHESLPEHLIALTTHELPEIRVEALRHIEQHRLTGDFAPLLVQGLLEKDGDPAVRGAALQTLCALSEAGAVAQVTPYLERGELDRGELDRGKDEAVRQGALVGLLRYGGIAGILAAASHLNEAEHAVCSEERISAAKVIGAVARQDFYEPLLILLQDDVDAVHQAALEAAAQVQHPRLLPEIVRNLRSPATRSAAMDTLLAYGPAVLPLIGAALDDSAGYYVNDIERLVRVCGQLGGADASSEASSDAIALLRQHLRYPHPGIQEQIVMALSRSGFQANGADRVIVHECIEQLVGQAATLLAVQQKMGSAPDEAVSALCQALQDEMDRVLRRIFYFFSLLYDGRTILRTADQLARGEKSALALELLDITLSQEEKALFFPLIEPKLSVDERLARLPRHLQPPEKSREAWLLEIITYTSGQWNDSWLAVCAVYAAGKLDLIGNAELRTVIEQATQHPDRTVRETATWVLGPVLA